MKFKQFSALMRTGIAMVAIFFIASCTPSKPSFTSIDVTGASYAKRFELSDQSGKVRRLSDFLGKVVVVFFGYTQCPDVCPTTLTEMVEVKKAVGADASRIQVLFVTVDPERDTPEVLKAYMENFDPSFLALRAPPDQLASLAASYKIHYKRAEGKTPTSYTMDHSAGSYIYDPQGNLRLFTRYGMGSAPLAADIRILLSEKR